MPADITTLTSLITAFRNESREEAVTTSSLGALLQKIADVIATTALHSDVKLISDWRSIFVKLGTILTNITIGSDDRNNVYLTYNKGVINTAAVTTNANAITIRQATTERAGAMRAQHVQDLYKCKSDITTINTSLGNLSTALSNFSRTLSLTNTTVRNNTQNISNIGTWQQDTTNTIESLQLAIRNLQQSISTITTMRQTSTVHIECQIKDGKIYIQGAQTLIKAGLTPVIFRYTIRTSRHRANKETGKREYFPTRKGWHRYYDNAKVKVGMDDCISFRNDDPSNDSNDKLRYQKVPSVLFNRVKISYKGGKLNDIRLPYGKHLYSIANIQRRFKFAIGFYKEISKSETFLFSELRTNLAQFKVQATAQISTDESGTSKYKIDYTFSR